MGGNLDLPYTMIIDVQTAIHDESVQGPPIPSYPFEEIFGTGSHGQISGFLKVTMKFEVNGHNGYKGKTVICQATICKVLGIKDLNIINDKFPWIFDVRHDQYGKIIVKQSVLKGVGHAEVYRFVTENNKRNKKYSNRIDCDTYFFLGFDLEWKNIEKTYIVPNKGKVRYIVNITISKNSCSSSYDEFKVDHIPYNHALQSLMRFIEKDGNIILVDIEDVDKWLKM